METLRHGVHLHGLHPHGTWAVVAFVAALVGVYGLGILVYSVLLPLTG